MLEHDSEFLDMKRVCNCCRTYHTKGKPWFSMVFACFYKDMVGLVQLPMTSASVCLLKVLCI